MTGQAISQGTKEGTQLVVPPQGNPRAHVFPPPQQTT